MAAKLPDTDVFDSPFRPTSESAPLSPKRKPKKVELVVAKAAAPQESEQAYKAAAPQEQAYKTTTYLTEPQWQSIHKEIHRLRMAGARGNEANISRVIGTAVNFWLSNK